MKINYAYRATLIASALAAALASHVADGAALTGTIDPVSGFLGTSAPIVHRYAIVNSQLVRIAQGTTAYSQTLTVNGQSRRYTIVRPDPAPAGAAPVLLLLHPNSTSPEAMAGLTDVADYVLTQGFWAVLPEAIGGKWKDNPGADSDEDVRFISALLDALPAQGTDARRAYSAGYSSGGFMSERLACELSDKLAAFGIDAATLRGTQVSACAPARQRAKVYFAGTEDDIVPYEGVFTGTPNGLYSAADTLDFWSAQQQCGGVLATTLPSRAEDGTTVQKNQYTGCAGGTALQLYTVYGGGHTWPGGRTSGFISDVTTMDIHATGLIWLFVRGQQR